LIESQKNESLKSKINKQPAPKVTIVNQQENTDKCNTQYFEARISQLEIKLKEKEELISMQNSDLLALKNEFDKYKKDNISKDNGKLIRFKLKDDV
jgi:hypothetical protein